MKKIMLIPAIALSGLIFNTASAQIEIQVGLGYNAQPVAYDATTAYGDADDYYYLPDVGAYYDVTDQCYVYFDGTEWVTAAYLPGAYRDYDWRNSSRFEIRAFRPYMNDDFYRSRYSGQRLAEWTRGRDNDHNDRGYANQGYRNGDRRDGGDGGGYNQPSQYHREGDQGRVAYQPSQYHRDGDQGMGAYQPDQQRRNYNQPVQQSRGYNQPMQQNRDYSQPAQQNRNNGWQYQNHSQDNRGGAEHFVQSRQQNYGGNRRMSKF